MMKKRGKEGGCGGGKCGGGERPRRWGGRWEESGGIGGGNGGGEEAKVEVGAEQSSPLESRERWRERAEKSRLKGERNERIGWFHWRESECNYLRIAVFFFFFAFPNK